MLAHNSATNVASRRNQLVVVCARIKPEKGSCILSRPRCNMLSEFAFIMLNHYTQLTCAKRLQEDTNVLQPIQFTEIARFIWLILLRLINFIEAHRRLIDSGFLLHNTRFLGVVFLVFFIKIARLNPSSTFKRYNFSWEKYTRICGNNKCMHFKLSIGR